MPFSISSLHACMYAVLTAEWLPRLHGLLWYQRLLYKTTSFLVVFLLFPHSEIRKRGGNNKETTFLLVLYN